MKTRECPNCHVEKENLAIMQCRRCERQYCTKCGELGWFTTLACPGCKHTSYRVIAD